jgi:hypothetical protein
MDGGWEMGIPFLFWYCVKVFRAFSCVSLE